MNRWTERVLGVAAFLGVVAVLLGCGGVQKVREAAQKAQRANQLIAALPQMTQYVLTLPPDVLAKSAKKTRAERIDSLEKDPKGMAILKKNGLTAKDYIIGVPALRMALWRAQGMAESSLVYASPANLAFAKANLAQLKPKWDAAEGRPAK